jgi:uncharacterized protein with HEPN domain
MRRRGNNRQELYRLLDIRQAIHEIRTHPRFGEAQVALESDKYFRAFCEKQLVVIGEAARVLCREFGYDTRYPQVRWAEIREHRAVLVHRYWAVSSRNLWLWLRTDVVELEKCVGEIIVGWNCAR